MRTKGTPQISVLPYEVRHRSSIWALSKRVRPHQAFDEARWHWQYERNPYADVPDIALAMLGDELVGQIATMRVVVRLQAREVAAVWQGDSMVDPRYRRRGIATMLLEKHASLGCFKMALGTSDAMFALRMKEGWLHVRPSQLAVRFVDPKSVLEEKVGSKWLAKVLGALYGSLYPIPKHRDSRIAEVDRFDAAATELWERVSPKLSISVRRDATFLNWRYVDVPGKNYVRLEFRDPGRRLQGYCVAAWRRQPRILSIADIFADPDDKETVRALVGAILHLAKEGNATRVFALATDPRLRRHLGQCGFVTSRYECRLTCAPVPGVEGVLRDASNWYVTLGDSDEELTA